MQRLHASALLFALAAACGGDGDPPSGRGQALVPTYWSDMVPLFSEHCMSCHREGGIAPFRLDRYTDAKQHADSIRAATAARSMPPWGVTSDGSCGEFRDSLALSDAQIASIGAWVAGGTREGTQQPLELPTVAHLAGAQAYTTPLFLPEAQGGELAEHDEYRCFLMDADVAGQAFITGYEVLPGTPAIVHHVLAMLVDPRAPAKAEEERTNGEQMAMLDAQSPERDGWPCFGSAGDGVDVEAFPVVWAPGQGIVEYPDESGVPITSEHKVVLQVHYNLADVQGLTDRTEVRLRTADQVARRGVFLLPDSFLDSLFEDTPEMLAPGKKSVRFSWRQTLEQLGLEGATNLELYGVMPHMHQLGRKYRMNVVDAAGGSRCAADVQSWDFHWQRMYFYAQPIALGPDSDIQVTCDFDTSERATPVLPGWGTQNEMCLATLYVTVPLAP